MKLSDIIKLELMKYFRFERQFTMVCTECVHNSDVSALSNNTLIEVEVKISKSDFRREFQQTTEKSFNYWKEQKHRFYLHPEEAWNGYIIPNKFYFCVPAELASWALDYMQDKNSKYGLLAYDTERTTGNTHIVTIKGAKAMHKNTPEQKVFLQVAKRMANELITAKEIQLEELLQRTANHYEGAVQQNKELQQELIEKNKQLEVFNVEYFKGLTYEAIAELAKTAIRITAENRELTHKIEDYVEEQCSNCEETSEHCEFCDIKDLKEIGGCNDTKN